MSGVLRVSFETALESGYVSLAHRIVAEFKRMPTLAVTTAQLSHFLEVDDVVSVRVLQALVAASVLERGQDQRYRLLVTH